MQDAYGDGYQSGTELIKLIHDLWANEEMLKGVYKKAQTDCAQFLKDIKITK